MVHTLCSGNIVLAKGKYKDLQYYFGGKMWLKLLLLALTILNALLRGGTVVSKMAGREVLHFYSYYKVP